MNMKRFINDGLIPQCLEVMNMNLKLNLWTTDYKPFRGLYTAQMPLIVAERRTPMSVAKVMRRRVEVLDELKNAPRDLREEYKKVIQHWWYATISTGDGAVRHRDGSLTIVLDAPYLWGINPDTNLVDGNVSFDDADYRRLAGDKFSAKQVERYFNKPLLNIAQTKKHPGWLALARGDEDLLARFVDAAFSHTDKPDDENQMMPILTSLSTPALYSVSGVFKPMAPGMMAYGRAWDMGGIARSSSRSPLYADGRAELNFDDHSLLVGIAQLVQLERGEGGQYATYGRVGIDCKV